MNNNLNTLILNMFELGMIKFGEFTLKSGKKSYIYADVRTTISHPSIYKTICDLIYNKIIEANLKLDFICGVPYSALTFASGIGYAYNIPQLLKRKEVKEYGTKKILEGDYKKNDTCVLIEDVVTSGSSIIETADIIKNHHINVSDVITFINRNQGGDQNLLNNGYKLHSIINLPDILEVLVKSNKISQDQKNQALELI